MTLEELKTEASQLGYSLCKKVTYEKLSTCKCGSKRIASAISYPRDKYYHCINCGFKGADAKTKYKAIQNWNNAARDCDAYQKHMDASIAKLLETKQIEQTTKLYEIWAEGYAATGGCSGATLLGRIRGENFKDACKKLANKDLAFGLYFDEKRMTYWGCSLFDNEADARKSFG